MIQAIMLVALGFMVATLVAVLLAPSLWSRALRLSRKRLEATLPLTLAEIDASRDQIRAAYAVRLRRLEIALAKAKQRVALQLVDNSRLQMQIATLGDTISATELKLEERQNAALVLEQTITRRMPELERDISTRRAELQFHSQELESLQNRLGRREEQLAAMQQTASSTQEELDRLRQAMEKTGSDKGGRLLRRPSQWSLDDYRSEYDRLHLELSKMRQQLRQLQQKDAQQTSLIKGELQKLAEMVLTTRDTPDVRQTVSADDIRASRPTLGAEARRERPVPYPSASPEMAKPATVSLNGAQPSNPPAATYANSTSRALPGASSPAPKLADDPEVSRRPEGYEQNKAVEAPKFTRSRIAQGVTTTVPSDKDDRAQDIPLSKLVLTQEGHALRSGPTNGQTPSAEPPKSSGFAEPGPDRMPPAGAKKVFADAQQLQTISELALAQDKIKGQGSSSPGGGDIAREAADGVILDATAMDKEILPKNNGNGSSAQRNLLDRLRDASKEAGTIDK